MRVDQFLSGLGLILGFAGAAWLPLMGRSVAILTIGLAPGSATAKARYLLRTYEDWR